MKKSLYIILVIFLAFSCKNNKNNNDTSISNTVQDIENTQQEDDENQATLTIKGEQIWVRSEPTTGDVVLKLDDNTECKILEKGKQETINGVTDYWYRISYEDKEGWVFGSQTSEQQQNISEDELFLTNFLSKVKNNSNNLHEFFIDGVFYELYNPGAMIYIEKVIVKDSKLFTMFKYNATSFDGNFIHNEEPIFNMDSYSWDKKGYFINSVTDQTILTKHVQYTLDYYEEEQIKEMKEAEKFITHKLHITDGDGIIFYFGKINGTWKIIAVDVSTNDA